MKVAALYDIHGNLPALEAVLGEVENEGFDAVVVGGDVFWGPWPAETLERLRRLPHVRFVRGNCDRETIELDPADPRAVPNAWVADRLDPDELAFAATWPLTVETVVEGVGEVCFCHATPRSDTELVTPRTPEAELAEAIAATSAGVVVCGHTHVQFDLPVGIRRLVNAGSVGWPYEGRPGAYWLALGPGIHHRRTGYDVEATAAAVSWPGGLEAGDLLQPPGPEEAIEAFENARKRDDV
jgi:predicted phosphodiesterase